MYDTRSSLLVAKLSTEESAQTGKTHTTGKPTNGSHDPNLVVLQTNYHTLTTMGFQPSLP